MKRKAVKKDFSSQNNEHQKSQNTKNNAELPDSARKIKVGNEREPAQKLSLVAQPADYFKEQVGAALSKQKIRVDISTEFYLVDLLTRFMFTDNLFVTEPKTGVRQEEVLALLLKEAFSSENVTQKQKQLRRLGDVSLYTAGFFSDSLNRKIVDVDYYIGMGQSAFANLAQMRLDAALQTAFEELAARFHKFVDVLSEMAESSQCKDAKDILRLYEVWLKTKSEKAEKTLKEAGIIPNRLTKKDWQ